MGKRIESAVEADFDRRTKLEGANGDSTGRYKVSMDRKFSTLNTNSGLIEKYLKCAGLTSKGAGLPEKMSKEKNLMSKSLMRGGLAIVSASLSISPSLR